MPINAVQWIVFGFSAASAVVLISALTCIGISVRKELKRYGQN